jgi:hypothetical protein
MTHKYLQVDNAHKEFYYYLGLISTKFAILESNLLSLLGKLVLDDFILTNTLLERNSLSQNIELLKKINKYRNFEEDTVEKLIGKISSIRGKRNLFIHGIWGKPFISENDLMVICSEPKLLYKENSRGKSWSSKKNHEFRLGYLRKQVDHIDEILMAQDYLLKKLENFEY